MSSLIGCTAAQNTQSLRSEWKTGKRLTNGMAENGNEQRSEEGGLLRRHQKGVNIVETSVTHVARKWHHGTLISM